MSLFDNYPAPTEPPQAAEAAGNAPEPVQRRPRPTIHQATSEANFTPACGAKGGATVLPSLVDCPGCLSRRKAAVRPPQTVYRRIGVCLACSSVATDGEFCAHHAQIVAQATAAP